MFRITTETCRTFTFSEVLIMAAMNVENARVSSEDASHQRLHHKDKDHGLESL